MRNFALWVLFSAFIVITSCSDKNKLTETIKPDTDGPEITEENEPMIPLSPDWEMDLDLMEGFPKGIQVFKTTKPFKDKPNVAYCVIFDPKKIDFKPTLSTVNKTISKFYSDETGEVYAALNAGFFGTNASYSLIQYNNKVSAVNIKSLSRPYQGANATYYPTRGAFSLSSSGAPEVGWVYHVGAGNGVLYAYPHPSPNILGSAPQPIPTENFPAGGKVWNKVSAVGGSPILIKDGKINITDAEELISIDNGSARARSAIGYSAKGMVVLLAVEGNNNAGGRGMSLPDLAEFMKEMGCIGALNLDGGGSSFMIVNGKKTIQSSDATERAVISAIVLKKK